jgi:hypothetical protein
MQDIKNNLDKILKGELKILYNISLRIHLIRNNILGDCCNKCKLTDWQNQPITLEVEHIDGDKWNNKRDNLELLCPNCHSQTATYKRKNKKNENQYISDNIIIEKIKANPHKSINQILSELKLCNKGGGNYDRIYKLCRNNTLVVPQKIKKLKNKNIDYKQIHNEKSILILNSGIDFSKIGWRLKLANFLNCTPQYAGTFIKKHMPEFYINNCWKSS